MYESENMMSKDFEKYIKSIIGNTYFKECQGLFGIPDYVCFSKLNSDIRVVAFELKLTKWRTAIKQAFRYKSFSDYSFVVLPEKTAKIALAHLDIFVQYGIGLISIEGMKCEVKYSPIRQQPFSVNMRNKVVSKIKKSRKHAIGTIDSIIFSEQGEHSSSILSESAIKNSRF